MHGSEEEWVLSMPGMMPRFFSRLYQAISMS